MYKTTAKDECYIALMRMVDRCDLNGQRKLAKSLNIKEKNAKNLLNGIHGDFTQDELIRMTSVLIYQRIKNAAP